MSPFRGPSCLKRKPEWSLAQNKFPAIIFSVSTVQEIEAVIPKLSRAEIEEVRARIDDFLEDKLELRDDVKAKLAQSRHEIAAGSYTTRQPQ